MKFAKFVIGGLLAAALPLGALTVGAPSLASAAPPGNPAPPHPGPAGPKLTVPPHVRARGIGSASQFFTFTGRGFDPSTTGTLSMQASFGGFVWASVGTDARGNFNLPRQYWVIGTPCDFTATFTYTDSLGLQASATQVVNGC